MGRNIYDEFTNYDIQNFNSIKDDTVIFVDDATHNVNFKDISQMKIYLSPSKYFSYHSIKNLQTHNWGPEGPFSPLQELEGVAYNALIF